MVVMGDRGRLVVPQEVRSHLRLEPGSTLALVETHDGMLLLTRDQLKALVRRDLEGESLVERLIADRMREAVDEAATLPTGSGVA
jgi:AbrB family looped-hinge helix DNA binding protein